MNSLSIPLTSIMGLALLLYTISIISAITLRKFNKINMAIIHCAGLVSVIGLIYMAFKISKLTYTPASYNVMTTHAIASVIVTILVLFHAVIATILRRKCTKESMVLGNAFNIFSFILWFICTVLFFFSFSMGILPK